MSTGKLFQIGLQVRLWNFHQLCNLIQKHVIVSLCGTSVHEFPIYKIGGIDYDVFYWAVFSSKRGTCN